MDERLARAIGESVRARRKARGLSQEQLAEAIDIAPQFLGRIERGLTLPSVPTLCSLASALGITPGGLLPEKGRKAGARERRPRPGLSA